MTQAEPGASLPRTDRPDAPAYLTRHQSRSRTGAAAHPARPPGGDGNADGDGPLYLRSFRARQAREAAAPSADVAAPSAGADAPVWQGGNLGVTRAWAEVTRTKEIVPERREQRASVVTDVYFVRHGETQGYSSESGLTPLGSWQAHLRGQEIARRVMPGHRVVVACAPTNRARQTAEHLRRGLTDNTVLFGRDAKVGEVSIREEFRNFSVATPDGARDVTAAFRLYHREMERYERVGLGERPGWLVEIDRFWGVQQGGGDPIAHWLTMPLMYFEPPVSCVRRFWGGILDIQRETAGNTVVVATHSGPIRAFATWAMGYDPGEPFNAEDRPSLGGKTVSLAEMIRAGLPVPPGFAVTTHAFRLARDASGTMPQIVAALDGLDVNDLRDVSARAAVARGAVLSWPFPGAVEAEIRASYQQLCDRARTGDVPVAVRSSATCEDSPGASFAGEHDTYLWVRGADDVITDIRRCWASLFTDRAVCYRAAMGYQHRGLEMCVAVQKMVRPRSAGVAFTLNPGDGDRSTVAIDSAWGFGEGVVSGEVTPDNFLIDKVLGSISRRTVSAKTHAYRLGDDGTIRRVELPPEEATAPSLSDSEIAAIARFARAAEKHYGCPQDVEWAVDADLPDGANIVLLQARPETVWSTKTTVVSTGADPLTSIVSTLVNPLHARKA